MIKTADFAIAQRAIELRGIPVSSGTSFGPVRIVRNAGDTHQLRDGEILVCTVLDREMMNLLGVAGGIVSERGGVLGNPAIIAREYGIPAVFAVMDATSVLSDGQHVMIDGARGLVISAEA